MSPEADTEADEVDPQSARSLVVEALHIDGAHHKQWYLEQIGEALGMDMDMDMLHHDRGIAP